MTNTTADGERLLRIVTDCAWFMRALRAGAALGLSSWCIGGGALRNLVWDHLHVATWPEYATAVAVRLDAQGQFEVIAPHGLGDLLGMRIRGNPTRASEATYRQRMAKKRYAERWPRVEVYPAADAD